ncbi:PREDICTED: coiled-coil domain-containing protein 91 isoform X3 [Chinchilla lanigera]|uniref:coiled-coil domain-containing protein 91 isoform X3 n=1 Tax=Chinchilla lanigera TaxID=34839 RepID=UPI0006981E1C|nr:PREDICTED: coiled-coil domain-containing protein 91 isoform X3 [Chinchilla lanigera]XP_013361399.1 PREDICTED: coiled-coil domain-containing protein 91 isoform X3 [Chinchilla lanigera]XP_013361400.1 PREDICTED: coiled-coil domain-containing protein 91 isoform X3 [Chinchilla lanigera]
MMILVALRLQRLSMMEMVRPKHLLLFPGLPFLQSCPLCCPLVSGVHLSPVSPELVLDHEHSSSASCLSPDAILSSPDNVHTDSSIGSHTVPKAQVQQSINTHLDIPLFPLALSDETSNGTVSLVDDCEDLATNVSNIQLQQKVSDLEMKLKMSEEEKQRIKKDVESLMEKHDILEKDFLKEKDQEAISFQDRYKELQEKHKQELEDMRKMGHEALGIIVDEYKVEALLQSSVKQQVEAIEKQYISAIEKQAHKCEELLNAQHQRLLEMLDTEKELLKENIKEALIQQSQEQKEILEKCLEEERQKNKEALVSAAKLEQEAMKDIVMKAIEEERKNLEKAHAEERELWKTEHAKDQEKVSQAIETALQEQRKISQETVKAAIVEEQRRSAKAVEEAVRRTRDELIEYVKEQRRIFETKCHYGVQTDLELCGILLPQPPRCWETTPSLSTLDQVLRQRSLSSLELFLSCAQKQLSALIATEPLDVE